MYGELIGYFFMRLRLCCTLQSDNMWVIVTFSTMVICHEVITHIRLAKFNPTPSHIRTLSFSLFTFYPNRQPTCPIGQIAALTGIQRLVHELVSLHNTAWRWDPDPSCGMCRGKQRTLMAGKWQKNFTEGTSGSKVDDLLHVSSLQRLARERIVEMQVR